MGMHMIDADEWPMEGESQRFGGRHSDNKTSDKPGTMGDGNCVQVGKSAAGLLQGAIDEAVKPLHVGARGNFRHHASIFLMQLNL